MRRHTIDRRIGNYTITNSERQYIGNCVSSNAPRNFSSNCRAAEIVSKPCFESSNMNKLLQSIIKLAVAILAVNPIVASADTFDGRGSVRVEACKAAKDQGRMVMERKYTTMANQALGGKNQLKVGECDCSEDTKSITSSSRWTCIVDVEIASVSLPLQTTPGGSNRATERQVRSDSGKGDTEVEACSNAKYVASQAVSNLGGTVRNAGSCTCGRTSGSSFRFECMVDTAYDRLK